MADVPEKHMEVARKALSAAWMEHEVEYGGGAHIMSCGMMDRFAAAFAAALANAEREGMKRAAEIAEERAEWVPLRPGDMRKAILCAGVGSD